MRTTTRKTRSDKKIHVNPALDHDTHEKLFRLAISCSMTKTQLAELIIKTAVNTPELIRFFQDRYNVIEQYRVMPVIDKDGRVFY